MFRPAVRDGSRLFRARIVMECETMADRAESQERLNEAFWNALEEIGERQPDGSIVLDLSDLDEMTRSRQCSRTSDRALLVFR